MAFLPRCKIKMLLMEVSFLSLLLLMALVVVLNAKGKPNDQRSLLAERLLGVKHSGTSRKTRNHIIANKKAPFGNKLTYPLLKHLSYRSTVSNPYFKQYTVAYAPSSPQLPPSLYQTSRSSPSPSQYSDTPVSSFQSPYFTSYSNPPALPYSAQASSYPAQLSYFPPSSYPPQAAFPSYSSSIPPNSYISQTQQPSYPSSSSSNPFTYDQTQPISYPIQVSATEYQPQSNPARKPVPTNDGPKKLKPKPSPPDRTEKFEIRGRLFQSIGCWADSPKDRAMATLEGTHTQLKHQDYKTRVNSLMKCAEAADENNLKLFALQNGGQCFGGSNNENTYHKYGRSSECEGDGEGGPWSNEVYSFLDDDGQFLVKPPKENAMDKSNAASTNGSKPTCPNPCATNRPSPGFPTVCPSPCNSSIPAQTTGSNSCATPQAINTGGTEICGNPCPPSGSVCNATTSNGNQNQASSGGCGSPCPSPPAPTPGNCTNNGTGTSSCGPSVSAGCINIEGGLPCESQCVTVDSGCLQIPSEPVTSCVSPNPGNSYGGCSGYGSQIIPGSPCVIQGKLIEGCPNGTTGNVTGPSGKGTRGSNNTNSAPKCKAKADVGFIIDGSGSIENALKGNYKKVLQFVKNVVKAFEVSKEKTHIGIISYDHDAKVISGFDQHYKKEEIIKEIENMNYPGGGTNTGKALAKAKKELFDKSARAGVPNVAIVLTDGQSNDDVGPPSQELRDSGCSVFSVGMGENFNMAELQQIATDPDSQHVFKAKFEDLDSIADTIVDTVCKGAGGEVKPPPPPLPVPTTPSPKPKKIKCKAKVDLAFLLDGSDRIDYEKEGNFKKCQEFIKALISSYNIGKDGTNVGLVLFYKTSKVVFEFEKYLDVTSLTQAIDTIPYPNKGSNTGIGLDLVKTGLFDVSARQGVRTVLIVITGGSSQDDVQGPSKKLRDMGVTIFCIGLGTEFQRDQLRDMATDPDSKYVITAGYEELNQVLPNFKKICCEASGGTISTTTSSGGRMGIGVGTSGRIGIGIKGSAGGSSSSSSSRIGIGTGRRIGIRIKGSSAGARGGSSSRIIRIKGSRSRGRRIRLKGKLRIRQRMRKIGGRKIILGKISKGSSKSNDNESYIEEVTENMAKENLFFGGFLGTGVCRDKVDLAFLVDAAGSTDSRGQQNFRTSLEFVKATSSMFSLDQLQSHVGFVVFSNNSPVVLDFDTLFDQKSVENAIDDIEYTGGLADIGTGLNLVKSDLFDSTSRQYVPRVLIAVISGKSTGDVAGPAKALRDAGVTVFCVGVGNNFDLKELDEIATDPDSDHVFTADVTELGLVVKAIKGKVCDGNVRPLALFPLNARYDARDVIGGNPEGQINQVIPSLGPDDVEDGSLAFLGTPDSYIEFPNDGRLDAKYSLTILVWIYPEKEGPIVNFQRDGWGANLWLAQSQKLLAHFVQRDQQQLSEPLQSNKIIPNKWNYVGATYDHTTGRAGLWVNGKFEDSKNLGKFELATNYSIRMGAREGDKRNFRGRISCLQVYNVPLTSEQINNAKDNCKVYE